MHLPGKWSCLMTLLDGLSPCNACDCVRFGVLWKKQLGENVFQEKMLLDFRDVSEKLKTVKSLGLFPRKMVNMFKHNIKIRMLPKKENVGMTMALSLLLQKTIFVFSGMKIIMRIISSAANQFLILFASKVRRKIRLCVFLKSGLKSFEG